MPTGLFHHMALSLEECITALSNDGQPTFPGFTNGTAWCNATWDTFLCWPAIPANTSYTLPCPPLRGLIPESMSFRFWSTVFPGRIEKQCHTSARWVGKDADDFERPSGWTNFTVCFAPNIKEIMDDLDTNIMKAQQIASDARKLEFVGLTLSLLSLIVAITIFSIFRRLRVFRNQIHQQLMLAILLTVVIRLILYIDLSLSRDVAQWIPASEIGRTINSTKIVCETFYILLEYLKTVAFAFMFIEGFYLHNTVVVQVFQGSEPNLYKYLVFAWGIPAVHVTIWITVMIALRQELSLERCLGEYYMQPEFWIMDGVRLLELVVNSVFLLNIVRVLWLKVKETHNATEMGQLKKSVRAALMLIPLLGIPNIMQTIPFTPTRNNIIFFAVFTYCASFFYMFQGLMVAVLYCFTNREVIDVIKSRIDRYKLRHQSADRLRRGSVRLQTNNHQPASNAYEHYTIYRDSKYGDSSYETTGFNAHNGSVGHRESEQSYKHELSPLVSNNEKPPEYEQIPKFP